MVRLLYLHYPTQFETVGNIRFKMKKTPHVFTGFTPLMLCTRVVYLTQKEALNRKSVVLPGAGYDIPDRPDLLSISMKPMKTLFLKGSVLGHVQNVAKSFIRMHAHRKQ